MFSVYCFVDCNLYHGVQITVPGRYSDSVWVSRIAGRIYIPGFVFNVDAVKISHTP